MTEPQQNEGNLIGGFNQDDRLREREAMVAGQLAGRDIVDQRVLAAMLAVPRHRFVPLAQCDNAYDDQPLPIGSGQTISQPYIVALMTQLLDVHATDRVLEIGTGSGYQTAVLARMVREVWTVEIVPELAWRARGTLAALGLANVRQRVGDGREGWPQGAPYQGIMVTAAPAAVQSAWVSQLADGGRMVVPIGGRSEQWLHRYTKRRGVLCDEELLPVRFVPLVGAVEPRHTDSGGIE
jgi:protein-L-isoaspartate(D-aspartate) O-methyltransferase